MKFWRSIRHDQAGFASLYVAIIFVAFVLLTGLVSDGSQIRTERRKLDDIAAQISRAVAQEVDAQAWHEDQQILLDQTRVDVVGKQMLERFGLEGTVTTSEAGNEVIVTVRKRISPAMSVIGAQTISATRRSAAVINESTMA